MNQKKSQMVGQVFVYILTLLVIVFIFIFGYNAISTFKQKSCEIDIVDFKNKLTNDVKAITPDYESLKTKEYTNPCNSHTMVCFVKNFDLSTGNDLPQPVTNPGNIPNAAFLMIEDSISDKLKDNAFLIKDNLVEESFFIGNIDVDSSGNILCVPLTNNQIELKIEGKGNHAKIYSG